MRASHVSVICISVVANSISPAWARPEQSPPVASAIVDLRTKEGVGLVSGQWRYTDAQIVETAHRQAGADKKPSGPPNRTHDISPHAGAVDFDDSGWQRIDATSLEDRRGSGRLSFGWYRLNIAIPEAIGAVATAGSTIYFEVVVDDYAEVWVNGRLPQTLGQSGGAMIRGWNAPNRVLLTDNAQPGERIQLAVFAANGPLSDPPANYIWIRSATLDFYQPKRPAAFPVVDATIARIDPAIDEIIPPDAKIEKIADGFSFTEGPVWIDDPGAIAGGYLLFSDPNKNVIHRWNADGNVSIFRTKSGYSGINIGEYHQPGSNGLTLDPQGRLTICEHGNRRVCRLEKNGAITVLADNYQGKRLNSPNDLVCRSDGALFFTDPPFGLPKAYDDPRKELPYCGVFSLYQDQLKLVSTDLRGPNGIAFSPDERYLYVANWDEQKKVVMRYEVQLDAALANGIIFFDMTSAPGDEALDGLKVDQRGNVFVSGPGGVWVLSSKGKHLGTIRGPELPANFAWGDADRRMLYLTARTGLYRVRLNIPGSGALVRPQSDKQ